jgi:isoquinoline 1-oxidoreductase beta subunit
VNALAFEKNGMFEVHTGNQWQTLALPRRADAAGFRTALYAGLDVVGPLYATKTEFGRAIPHIVASEGVPAAVRWLAAEFRE